MRLPRPLYERLPWLYVAMGVLMFAFVAYLGLQIPYALAYLALGVALIGTGVLVRRRRQLVRRLSSNNVTSGNQP